MNPFSRRYFLRNSGLATLGAAGFVLRADAQPTPASGRLGSYARYLQAERQQQGQQNPRVADPKESRKAQIRNLFNDKRDQNLTLAGKSAAATEDNILGPFYRSGAPFRGKVTPPLEPGTVLVISGRVWGLDTRKPLPLTALDIWQANAKGRYDNDDPAHPPDKDVFKYRTRLITDETGYYEFETIHPAPYKIGPEAWRPSHIHYLVRAAGYKTLGHAALLQGRPAQQGRRVHQELADHRAASAKGRHRHLRDRHVRHRAGARPRRQRGCEIPPPAKAAGCPR